VFVPSVEKGVMKACEEGILGGYRVVDVKIDFYDGKMHPVDQRISLSRSRLLWI
jgi:elongation factor G